MEEVDEKPPPDFVYGAIVYQHGAVLSELLFSGTAFPRPLEPDVEHLVELTAGTYRVAVAANESGAYDGVLRIERVNAL